MVADTADGADGVMHSVLLYGRYPDCARSQPPLAAEDDLNPDGAEEGLCPAQPAKVSRWAVDDGVGKTSAVACVKEPGGLCDIEEDVCAAHGAPPSSAWPATI